MKKYYFIFLFLILSSLLVTADELNLEKNKPINYKDLQFTLISVGNSNTIRLLIENTEQLIELNKYIEIYDLKIKNIQADYTSQTTKISLELQAECLVDEDCTESDPCKVSICNYRTCEFSQTKPGCPFESECKTTGSFEEINNRLSYCKDDNTWRPRKSYKEECNHNYECLSNICDNNQCDKQLFGDDKKMAPAWILIVIGSLLLIEGLFVFSKTKVSKEILKNMSFWREKTWKVLAIIEFIVGLVFIIWALA